MSIKNNIQPSFLKEGDKVAIISPAYTVRDRDVLIRAEEAFKKIGLIPVYGNATESGISAQMSRSTEQAAKDWYSASIDDRISELVQALEDPEIKAVICSRGGYGSIHMANRIQRSTIANNPKWVVGYSDISTLHAMQNLSGVMSILGDNFSSFAKDGDRSSCDELAALLFGSVPSYNIAPHPFNNCGSAEGLIVGGNMMTVEALMGSDADILGTDGNIIFLEEVEESMHAIDRLFFMLVNSGRLERCKALIFGQFTDCGKELGQWNSIEEMLHSYTSKLNIPVVFGMESGHGQKNHPLVLGANAELNVSENAVTLEFNIEGKKTIINN